MNPTTLNKNGWRVIDPPIPGEREGLDLSGLLIARDDKRGYGLLRLGDTREVTIRIEWFRPLKSETTTTTTQGSPQPTRQAKKSQLDELLTALMEQGL